MPLGDSITYDNHANDTRPVGLRTGYRQPLYLSLVWSGLDVDFVGGRVAGQDAVPSFDPDNEGWPGKTDTYIANGVYGFLVDNPADMVLLHIGTNALDPSPDDVEDILDEIDRYEQTHGAVVTVVLARIIKDLDKATATTEFNDNVQAMAQARIIAGDKIVIVDMEDGAGFDYAVGVDMWDAKHPNVWGYDKMAYAWENAIGAIGDRTLPGAYIVSPSEGQFFDPGSSILITARPIGTGEGVTRLDFFVDNVKVGEAAVSPFRCFWSAPLLPDRYSLTAVAVKDDVVFGPPSQPVEITTRYAPYVSITATDADAAENPVDPGLFTLTCDRAVEIDIAVGIALSGGAEDGVDFSPIGTSLTIPVGAKKITVDVVPFDDDVADEYESVTITIQEGPDYRVGTPATATVTIADDDISPAPFALVAPPRSARHVALTPKFTWSASDEVTGYTLVISETIDLAGPVVSVTVVDGTEYTLGASQRLEAGWVYYWSVTAENLKGLTTEAHSAPWRFETSGLADENDLDGDGLANADELAADPYVTDPLLWDTDDDGCPDDWEIYWGFDPTAPSDGNADPDGDLRTNRDEYMDGTDPLKSDLLGLASGEGCRPSPGLRTARRSVPTPPKQTRLRRPGGSAKEGSRDGHAAPVSACALTLFAALAALAAAAGRLRGQRGAARPRP